MKTDVPLAPRRGQTHEQFARQYAADLVRVLNGMIMDPSAHRTVKMPSDAVEEFMRTLMMELAERLPESAHIEVSRDEEFVHCAIWL